MSYPSISAIPGALAAVVNVIAPAALPAGTTCFYGETPLVFEALLTFQVAEITGKQTPATMSPDLLREEEFSLVCSLLSFQGGTPDNVAATQALMSSYALLAKAIGNNPWLSPDGTKANGTVRFAQMSHFHIYAETDSNGQTAQTMDFQIMCQARVTSIT